MKEVTIDGKLYREADATGERLTIVCVDNRGLTFVGKVDLSGDQEQVIIRDAQCIIRWGTTQHIAELADGPIENTRLGAKRDVMVFRRNIMFAYECNEEAWRG